MKEFPDEFQETQPKVQYPRYEIGDIVSTGFTDGYITDVRWIPELNAHIYFVEFTTGADWFRAGEIIKLYRVSEEQQLNYKD